MRHTSVLFTGTAKSPFSTPHISITTGLIYINFIYFMPSTYTTLHTKFEDNWLSSLQDIRFLKLPDSHFSSLHRFNTILLSQKTTFSFIDFLQIWYTNKAYRGLSYTKVWRCLS